MTEALLCLALNIYHESRGEPLAGQIATANVVMNRVESPRYPNDICSVVKQGHYWKGNPVRDRCSFSWWCDGKSDTPEDIDAWRQSVSLAFRVQNDVIPDITEGATHYHAIYVSPYWADHYISVAQIGQHIFYR